MRYRRFDSEHVDNMELPLFFPLSLSVFFCLLISLSASSTPLNNPRKLYFFVSLPYVYRVKIKCYITWQPRGSGSWRTSTTSSAAWASWIRTLPSGSTAPDHQIVLVVHTAAASVIYSVVVVALSTCI